MSTEKRLIMFDLGGVLADLGRPASDMALDITDTEFWSLWTTSNSVGAFEAGAVHERDFLESFSKELHLEETIDEFHRRFVRWQLKLFPHVSESIRELRQDFEIALLSNTNCIHWKMIKDQAPVHELFDYIFLSFDTGYSKPDKEAFEYVLKKVARAPDQIIFFDDSSRNVDAANRFGILAKQVHGNSGLAAMLSEAGIDA